MNYYLSEFKRRCKAIDRSLKSNSEILLSQITPDTFTKYEIVKRVGEDKKTVAFGLTLQEAFTLMKSLHSRLTKLPLNKDGSPIFELELYELTIAGRKRYQEIPQPRFNYDTKWID